MQYIDGTDQWDTRHRANQLHPARLGMYGQSVQCIRLYSFHHKQMELLLATACLLPFGCFFQLVQAINTSITTTTRAAWAGIAGEEKRDLFPPFHSVTQCQEPAHNYRKFWEPHKLAKLCLTFTCCRLIRMDPLPLLHDTRFRMGVVTASIVLGIVPKQQAVPFGLQLYTG